MSVTKSNDGDSINFQPIRDTVGKDAVGFAEAVAEVLNEHADAAEVSVGSQFVCVALCEGEAVEHPPSIKADFAIPTRVNERDAVCRHSPATVRLDRGEGVETFVAEVRVGDELFARMKEAREEAGI